MPRYDFNLSEVTATIPIFDKGDYEFVVGEPKAFERTTQEGKTSLGIRFPITCDGVVVDGDPNMIGKRTIYSGYLHTDGARAFPKSFLMACLGYDRNDSGEKAFNIATAGEDAGIDTDSGAVGDLWRRATGARVVISLTVEPNKNNPDEFIQQFVGFRPVATK